MGATVRDIMNTQLVYLREGDRSEVALQPMLDFGITAVPVLDEAERPTGMVAMRDLLDPRKRNARVSPVISIDSADTVEAAARRIAETGAHQLVVLDGDGCAVGMLSAVDVVRELIGLAPRHPVAIDSFGRGPRGPRAPART